MAIRKDLGHKNSGFKRGAILRLFINDIDEFLVRPPTGGAADDRPQMATDR